MSPPGFDERHLARAFAGFAAAAIVAAMLAMRDPVAYYAQGLRVSGRSTGVYAWMARTQPPAVGAWGLRAGIVNVLDPAARAIDVPDESACIVAARQRVLLIAIAEDDRPLDFNELQNAAIAVANVVVINALAAIASAATALPALKPYQPTHSIAVPTMQSTKL